MTWTKKKQVKSEAGVFSGDGVNVTQVIFSCVLRGLDVPDVIALAAADNFTLSKVKAASDVKAAKERLRKGDSGPRLRVWPGSCTTAPVVPYML